ncbi:MAG: hypothetical protein ABT01_06520 [Clostridium sp. SCN 57-10]|nr:MAG: hypothetical protein ABT01_06520 [Clostridium sp. SCN 57-10]
MKTAKKLLGVVLSVCMVLALLPATALADEPINYLVFHTGGPATPRATLAEAVEVAQDGDTIQAFRDVNEALEPNATITIGKKLTLDLGGYTVSLSAPNCTVLSVSDGASLVAENGTLITGTSGTAPAISVAGGSLTVVEEAPAVINIEARQNGLSVTGGGDATVTNVSIIGEGGAGVFAEGVSAADIDDFSQAKVLENVNVAPEEGAAPSPQGTYGVVAKDGAEIEVLGSISVAIDGVAKKIDCAAAWVTGYAGTTPSSGQSYIDVAGNVLATSVNGGAYGALATQGGTMQINGSASATGVGHYSDSNDGEGDVANVVAGAAATDPSSSVYVSYDVTASGLYNVYGCIARNSGTVAVSGSSSASGVFACGTAAYGGQGEGFSYIYINGDTKATATFQDVASDDNTASRAIGGYASGRARIEVWNLIARSDQSAWGIVADGTYSNVVAQAKVTYSSGDAAHSGGAAAMNNGTARINGYFTADSDTPVFLVDDVLISTPVIAQAYYDYTGSSSSAHIYVIGLGKISGTVTDAAGVPLPGITVWVYDEHFSAITDASGHYSLDPMPLYQPNCWATAEISPGVSRTINPFTRSMEKGSTTTVDFTNTSNLFAMTDNKSLPNDTATLGLIGTGAGSSNRDAVFAAAHENYIRIMARSAGSATITIVDASSHKATIDVTVDAHGYLTIGTITKYTAPIGPSVPDSDTETTPVTTVSGTTATATVTPTISGGAATGTVTAGQMSDALKKAQAAAGANGTPNVEIRISGASGASSVAATIPNASVQSLVSGSVGSLTVSSGLGSVSFDAAALKTLSGAGSGDVTVTVAKADSSTFSDAVKQAVGGRPVYRFGVTNGNASISQLNGTAAVSIPYVPTAGENPNAIVIYYIGANGDLETVSNGRYDAATGMVVFETNHFSLYAVGYHKVSFTDVASGSWYDSAVTFLAARGITSGTTATTFSPAATLTRGQFVTMLLRAYGVAAVANPTDNFADAGSTYYTGYLAAAKALGITDGVGGNKFGPDNAITRQEMFTLLYNTLKALHKLPSDVSGNTLSDFTDSGTIASWATDAMTALVKSGTVSGNSGMLHPTDTTTRAEMAQVLYNLLGK